jgi:hypothetical protein
MAFADRLEAALKARGFQVLIDRAEIYAFEDWRKRIQALIAHADTVIFSCRKFEFGVMKMTKRIPADTHVPLDLQRSLA